MASHQVLRSSSDSFATLAAIRRALIAREQIVCGRALGRRSNMQPLPLGHRLGLASLMDGTVPPAALPTTAPFFFETETAGLMFVRHRWPQSFRWWLFCRLPREDAAADYECAHDCPENPKLHLLHCGVLRSPNTTTSHYKAFRVSSLAQQPRQFGDIRRNPLCLIFAEQLGR
jgi:hypothetical protein